MNKPPLINQLSAAAVCIAAYFVPFPACAELFDPPPVKLNVVLILADDLGWTDLACFGSKLYETPNIDRLASDGVKFTQNYSACTVCSPTRAALLTGKYPARLHITDWIPGEMPDNPKLIVPDWTKYLPLEETTMANVFQKAGYATASLGKWHLGGEKYYPDKHGFDFFLAGTDQPNTKHYFSPYGIPTLPDGPKGEYVTDRSEEHTSELQSRLHLVCRLLLEKKKKKKNNIFYVKKKKKKRIKKSKIKNK